MMLGKTSLKMVSQEVVQTEFSVVHGLTRMHGLTRNEDICSMHTISMKCYDAKYRVKSENYIFSSSHVFYIALFWAILNWQIFANPENRGQVVFAY